MSKEAIDTIVNTFVVLGLITILVLSLLSFSRQITITLFLLIGVWGLDLYLKRIYNIDNITVFADLSFSTFVFSLGRGISLIDASGFTEPSLDDIFQVVITTFVLLLLWFGNLNFCNYINKYQPKQTWRPKQGILDFLDHVLALCSTICLICSGAANHKVDIIGGKQNELRPNF